ncbi:type II toxin-antitoxin system VapC family toxin [Dolichospermum sp. UHCC 0684]|uniref:type II toxin-antitoxin system VapC family toxin n=1 Tax=Nostocales TaxID=1161 RepID=UPI00029B5C37|nr:MULTISPECIES: type II toxin-antitoxin system VapC family toxin [Nostocales]MBO1051697.1 type II toxin-antitoxin system VapC family toxin [Dolichospermum sp. DET73]AFW93243.1 PIN domain-containing protein [Anabaena sp. 90]MEA5530595.1 type II toxin-antitoxin system VapC family toxin [Dolichospermum sp. UHCC 0684]MTJ18789.1 type II toxin-antitoxin system VapC family toxin [Dolichospermum sp. UHCC 0299]MTJ22733.1 type II toxin-antitoxin system VapC family toxin [Dolichospermum sp. UHCC 0352]
MNNYLICVDASFTINLINSKSLDSPFIKLWENWQQNSATIIAPTLFYYEITNALHRMNQANLLTIEDTEKALQDALNLGIVLYGSSQFPQLHEMALTLAKTLKLSAAYDAHYLALSKLLNAEFYTADKRLYNSIKLSLNWVHFISHT